jgi:16S rRNA processing protein RimM
VVLRSPTGELSVVEVSPFGRGKDFLRLVVVGSDSREAADQLRGHQVCVPRGSMPDLEGDEHYLVDLEGLEVRDGDGVRVGRVAGIVSLPTLDCLRVQLDEGIVEVPIMDRYFQSVDYAAGVIQVDHIDELAVEPATGGRRSGPGEGA